MPTFVGINSPEENRFQTISDFKDCMIRGGEVEFVWKNNVYDITHYNDKISISMAFEQATEELYDTADEVLEYIIDGTRLRDIITKVEVTMRTI